MAKSNLLTLNDVFVGLSFPVAETSIRRYQHIKNEPEFRSANKIVVVRYINDASNIYGPLYYGYRSADSTERALKNFGADDELLSDQPMVVGYKDGGLEYLSGIVSRATDSPAFENTLILPNQRRLRFCHPISEEKNPDLVALVRRHTHLSWTFFVPLIS